MQQRVLQLQALLLTFAQHSAAPHQSAMQRLAACCVQVGLPVPQAGWLVVWRQARQQAVKQLVKQVVKQVVGQVVGQASAS